MATKNKLAATPTGDISDLVAGLVGDAPGAAREEFTPPADPAPADPAPADPAPADPAPAEPAPESKSSVPSDVFSPKREPKAPVEEDDDVPPPDSVKHDAKANAAWAKVKADRRKFRDEARALHDELQKLKENPAVPDASETLALRKQIEEYEARIGQYDLASTKAFRQRFEAPIAAVTNRAVSLLVRSGKTPDEAKALVSKLADPKLGMDKIQELVADEPFALQGALVNAVTEIADISGQREEALKNWSETKAALKTQESRDEAIELAQDVERNTAEAVAQAVKEGNFMFALSPTNPEWNKLVQERISAVKGIVRSAKPAELVKWVTEGVTAQSLRKLFKEQYERAEGLQAQVAKLAQATPSLDGGAEPVKGPPPRRGPMSPEDAINQILV